MEVNKVIYIILCLFRWLWRTQILSGKMMSGLLHLLFCWTGIPHIIAIISAILTLLRPQMKMET